MICRLPPKFHGKWAEFCFTLRRTKEPTLVEFENCFQNKIPTFKRAYLPVKHELKKNRDTEEKYVGATLMSNMATNTDSSNAIGTNFWTQQTN